MMTALLDAVTALATNAPPQVTMVVAGFTKHLARNPMPDSELVGALTMAKALIDSVLDAGGEELPGLVLVPFAPVPTVDTDPGAGKVTEVSAG